MRTRLPLVLALGALTHGCVGEGDARTALRDDSITASTLTPTASGLASATYTFGGVHDDGRDCTGTVTVRITPPFERSYVVDSTCSLPEDPQRLAAMCESATYLGACGHAAHVFRDGTGVAADEPRAFRLAQAGCAAGESTACFYEGVAHERGRGTPIDAGAAIRCYRSACADDDAAACGNLGTMLWDQTPRDEAGALEAHAHACRLEQTGSSCHDHAAIILITAEHHTPAEITEAIATEDGECQRGIEEENLEACKNLGVLFREGTVVPADPARSLAAFRRACDNGRALSCVDVGVAVYQATPPDVAGALALFRRACGADDPVGCRNVGVVLRDGGQGVRRDPADSRAAFERACALGDHPACEELED